MLVCRECGSSELELVKKNLRGTKIREVYEPYFRCVQCNVHWQRHELRWSVTSHTFDVDGGRQLLDGKVHWPDQLVLCMPRTHVWNLVQAAQNFLQDTTNAQFVFEQVFCGQYVSEEDDALTPASEERNESRRATR